MDIIINLDFSTLRAFSASAKVFAVLAGVAVIDRKVVSFIIYCAIAKGKFLVVRTKEYILLGVVGKVYGVKRRIFIGSVATLPCLIFAIRDIGINVFFFFESF